MKQRKVRGLVFQSLFQFDLGSQPIEKLVQFEWDRPNLKEDMQARAELLLLQVIERLEDIDAAIDKLFKEFRLYRLSAADRAILRLGLFYLMYPSLTDIDARLAIHECLYLARNFSDENSYKLINRMLDEWAYGNGLLEPSESSERSYNLEDDPDDLPGDDPFEPDGEPEEDPAPLQISTQTDIQPETRVILPEPTPTPEVIAMLNQKRQQELYERALKLMPGGVNSPVRSFKSVGGTPLFIRSARGSKITDEDGNHFIDYVLSWGPMILGHNDPDVREAIHEAVDRGTSYGTCTQIESDLAELAIEAMPSVERVRMVNSGTEAMMAVIRLARAITRRPRIIKFDGCYHGHADSFLVAAGSGAMNLGSPTSPGVTPETALQTLVAPYNDLEQVKSLFDEHGPTIAAIVVEPCAGNMNFVLPEAGFLQGLRDLASQHGALLIFDEVMTGWRVSLNGAQGHFGVLPDLTAMGKVIGGGMPVGAFGGRQDLMEQISPSGPVYQAGTLSGNPVAMAAGVAALKKLRDTDAFAKASQVATQVVEGLNTAARTQRLELCAQSLGTMWGFYLRGQAPRNVAEAGAVNVEHFGQLFHALLEDGIYIAPSLFEGGFTSSTHREEDVEHTIDAITRHLSRIQSA